MTDQAKVPQDATQTVMAAAPERLKLRAFGVSGIDALLGQGIDPSATWLVDGAPGAGKSLLCAHFLAAGLARDEPGLYITASETPARLVQFFARYWPELERGIAQRQIAILDPSPYFTEARMASQSNARKPAAPVWNEIWRFIQDVIKQSRNQGAQRIIIDPITPLLLGHTNLLELWDIVQTLITALNENRGTTTLLTHPIFDETHFKNIGFVLHELCDGVMHMDRHFSATGSPPFSLQVVKRRYHELNEHEVRLHVQSGGRFLASTNVDNGVTPTITTAQQRSVAA